MVAYTLDGQAGQTSALMPDLKKVFEGQTRFMAQQIAPQQDSVDSAPLPETSLSFD